jgi:serine/threonine protein phosphatase PrpC
VKTISAVAAAGDTHPGLQREVNEDRFHVDPARGLFIVVDGVGGQAAGGKAADLAMRMLRARLERETGAVGDRVREAIAIANNEIFRAAGQRTEWLGMACVLTVAVVEDGRAVVGHVGDTRLYKLRGGRIEKITRDHSPVGEREDAHEISEAEAMRHPRRNEVYRDVGSEPHHAFDPDFIDLHEISFEPDAALLICSDGLTDLVDSVTIADAAVRHAGRPHEVVAALIQAANDAGGKDNVTIVFVEGEQFAAASQRASLWTAEQQRLDAAGAVRARPTAGVDVRSEPRGRIGRNIRRACLVLLIMAAVGYALYRSGWRVPSTVRIPFTLPRAIASLPGSPALIAVTPSDSIAAAIARAPAGGSVIVEPGEYRERLMLRDDVRVVSRVPRAATIRLPGTASEGDPAVVADGVSGATLSGFRIVGDSATPLGTGIFARHAAVSIVDVEVTGAAAVAVDLGDGADVNLLASDVHDNPGVGLAIRNGSSPRINHSLFAKNGLSERAGGALIVEAGAQPALFGNTFRGTAADAFRALGEATMLRLSRENSLADYEPRPGSPAPRGRRDR